MDATAEKFLKLAYGAETQQAFNDGFNTLLGTEGVTKLEMPMRLKKELAANPGSFPKDSPSALRFLTYFPLPMFREAPIFNGFLQVLSPEDKKKIPTQTTVWGDQKFMKAGLAPHAEECDIITLDLNDESKCTCGSPPPIAEAGANGDWKSEGYTLHATELRAQDTKDWDLLLEYVKDVEYLSFYLRPKNSEGDEDIVLHDYNVWLENIPKVKSGELVQDSGFKYPLAYALNPSGHIVALILLAGGEVIMNWTATPDRRKGLSSALHDLLKEKNKRDFGKGSLTEDGRKFWKGKDPITAGMLDFPRKKLPASVWLYEPENPLPRLQPKLRATIISEARYRLSKFGANLKGIMLYGGAATYQYHEGGDIDCSCYIDWDSFKGDEEILDDAFKSVEIPWDKYVVHLFVKPSNQQEQIEVADAYYDVMRDEWELPPLVLPKNFDPEVFFKPMVEMAEKKAQKMDLMMGEVSREWSRLKKCLRALKEGARDEEAVREKAEVVRSVLLDKIDVLCEDFVKIWKNRKKLHDQLREKYINDRNIGRFERFQYPEVVWKYLDEMGYVEFLKVLAKANEEGVIRDLIESATPQLPDNLPELEEGPDEIEPD